MPGSPIAANYCPQGCYWPCEHRAGVATAEAGTATEAARAPRPAERWTLGPGNTDDDPEQRALDEWRLWSVAGIEPERGFREREFCTDCGETFTDAAAHAHQHARRRQLGFDL
jgi:hypothetical protein